MGLLICFVYIFNSNKFCCKCGTGTLFKIEFYTLPHSVSHFIVMPFIIPACLFPAHLPWLDPQLYKGRDPLSVLFIAAYPVPRIVPNI